MWLRTGWQIWSPELRVVVTALQVTGRGERGGNEVKGCKKKLSCDNWQLLRRLWEISALGCRSKHQAASLETSSCSATGQQLSS